MATALLGVGSAVLIGSAMHPPRLPLSAGASAGEAWTYIHTPAAWESHGAVFAVGRRNWKAYGLNIQCDERYYLRWWTNRLVATRHVAYVLNTNGIIIARRSRWKLGG